MATLAISPGMTWGNIRFREHVPGSPAEQWADDQARAVRMLDVDWDRRYDFAAALVGYPRLRTIPGTLPPIKYISRSMPLPYSLLAPPDQFGPSHPILYAVAINRSEGVGKPDHDYVQGMARYPTCRLWVEFRTLDYDLAADDDPLMKPDSGGTSPYVPYENYGVVETQIPDEATLNRAVARYWEPAYKASIVPKGLFLSVDDVTAGNRKPIPEALNKTHPTANLIYLHRMRPEIPVKAILATVGRVNDATFDNGYPAGTLLCQVPRIRPYFTALGRRAYDIRYVFTFMPNVDRNGVAQGHNSFFRKVPGVVPLTIDYVLVSTDGTSSGQKMFRSADYLQLFRPDAG